VNIKHFFDQDTFTLTYIVSDNNSKDCVIIDPVLDYDQASGLVEDRSLKEVIDFIKQEGLKVQAILETHAHADHLTGSQILKQQFPHAAVGIGARIKTVQELFKNHFNLDFIQTDGSQFNLLFKDGEEINFGTLKMKALPTPGHTPACMSYLFGDAVFTGDALFMPDYGTGRCDFPKGSSKDLYQSVTKQLYVLPDSTRVFVGHDYGPNGREIQFQTTIGESKKNNIQLKASTSEDEFVSFREARDRTLKAPRLLLPSIQINIDAGHLPPKESNGKSYLKIPLTLKLDKGTL
jgi:glyoxylase-like metal-dependent hydrolase (beta-lactamase superfamily II)